MKKLTRWIGFFVSWCLYIAGDVVSRCIHDGITGWMYPAYNKLMVASVAIQDWSDAKGPWEDPGDLTSVAPDRLKKGKSKNCLDNIRIARYNHN